MSSLTQWTWVLASSGRWWRTEKPGMLQSMGLQRVGHDWVTKQQKRVACHMQIVTVLLLYQFVLFLFIFLVAMARISKTMLNKSKSGPLCFIPDLRWYAFSLSPLSMKLAVRCCHVPECMLSHFSRVWLCATLWTIACQAPLPMGFSRQEFWSELPCLLSGDLPEPGIEPTSPTSPAVAGRFFPASTTWEACTHFIILK